MDPLNLILGALAIFLAFKLYGAKLEARVLEEAKKLREELK